jgi:hypothetical protein
MAIISLPAAAGSATGSKSSSGWSNTGWVQITASTAADYKLLCVVFNVTQTAGPAVGAADVTSENLVEIGTGAGGAEVIQVQMGSAHRADTLVNHIQWNATEYWLPEPIVIPAGTRVAFRAHGGTLVALDYVCRLILDDEVAGSVTGTLAETELDDTLAASGTFTPPTVTGTLAETELNDTLAGAGAHGVSGSLAETETNDTTGAAGLHFGPLPVTEPFTVAGGFDVLPIETWGIVDVDVGAAAANIEVFSDEARLDVEGTGGAYVRVAERGIFVVHEIDDINITMVWRTDTELPLLHFFFKCDATLQNGYVLVIDTDPGGNVVSLCEITAGTIGSALATQPWTGIPSGDFRVRIQSDGNLLRFVNWPDGDPQPGFTEISDSTYTGAGQRTTGFGIESVNDNTAIAFLDDVVWDEFAHDPVSGTLAATEDDDTLAASGTFTDPSSGATGTLAETEDNDTLAGAGAHGVSGSLAETEADDTLAASGSSTVGSLAETEADDTVAAAGAHGVSGSLAETELDDTLAASGTFTPDSVSGTLAVTEQNDTLVASGSSTAGSLAVTEADDTLAADGAHGVSGTVAVTEQNDTLEAIGETFSGFEGTVDVTEQNDTLAATGEHIRPQRARRGFRGIAPRKWNHRYLVIEDERRKLLELLPEVDLSEPEVVIVAWYPEDEELMMLC